MAIQESECVILKRNGAEYVAGLLSGKSRKEELEFWSKRTERLRIRQKIICSGEERDKEEKSQ